MNWTLLLFPISAFTLPLALAENERQALVDEARDLSQQYAATLKPELLSAIEQGGLASAIDFCSKRAPEIGEKLSETSGWQVKRISSKPRNTEIASADEWERTAIAELETMRENGTKPEALEYFETSETAFRYARAQIVAPLCLNCHGDTLSAEVSEALATFYPHDQATGYQLGQIRGIISLEKPL